MNGTWMRGEAWKHECGEWRNRFHRMKPEPRLMCYTQFFIVCLADPFTSQWNVWWVLANKRRTNRRSDDTKLERFVVSLSLQFNDDAREPVGKTLLINIVARRSFYRWIHTPESSDASWRQILNLVCFGAGNWKTPSSEERPKTLIEHYEESKYLSAGCCQVGDSFIRSP